MDTVIYVVQQGDSLFEIAKKYHTTVNMIARYNGIADTDFLEVGRVLRIPVSTIPSMNVKTEYTVQSGDTLEKIADKFGTTVEVLVRFNGIADSDNIEAGQIIKIPVSASTFPMKKNPNEYIIKEGDTLFKIAERFDIPLDILISFNEITNPDSISAGQAIKIPRKPIREKRDERTEYIVKEGDTLWKIGREYDISVAELININRLTQPDLIYPGQIIIIRR